MDDVRGAEGKRARFLQPGRLFGDKDHLGILRPALELVLQLEEVRGIVEIKIEDAVMPQLSVQAGLERPELDLKETCQLFAQTIPVAAQISKIRDLVHHPTLKNSSACRQLSKLPGQARLHENMTQSFTLI
jgi:hypothetical protein